jgi:hypothetical protein
MIHNGRESSVSPRELTRQLEGEIAILREELSQLVAELDRRRHEALNVKLQVKRHAPGLLISGGALIAAAAGFVWFQTWRSRRLPRVRSQVHQLREKLMALVPRKATQPERPRVINGILTAAANAAVAVGIKKLVERGLRKATRTGPAPSSLRGPADRPAELSR